MIPIKKYLKVSAILIVLMMFFSIFPKKVKADNNFSYSQYFGTLNQISTSGIKVTITNNAGDFASGSDISYAWGLSYNGSPIDVENSIPQISGNTITVDIYSSYFQWYGAGNYQFSLWVGKFGQPPDYNSSSASYIIHNKTIVFKQVCPSNTGCSDDATFSNNSSPIKVVIGENTMPKITVNNLYDYNSYYFWWIDGNNNLENSGYSLVNPGEQTEQVVGVNAPNSLLSNAYENSSNAKSVTLYLCITTDSTGIPPTSSGCINKQQFEFDPPSIYPYPNPIQINQPAQVLISFGGVGTNYTFVPTSGFGYLLNSNSPTRDGSFVIPIGTFSQPGNPSYCMIINSGANQIGDDQNCQFKVTFNVQASPSTSTNLPCGPTSSASISLYSDGQQTSTLEINKSGSIDWNNICIPSPQDVIKIFKTDSSGNNLGDPVFYTYVDCKNVTTGQQDDPNIGDSPLPSGNCSVGPFTDTGNYKAYYVSIFYQNNPLASFPFVVTLPNTPTVTTSPQSLTSAPPAPVVSNSTGQLCNVKTGKYYNGSPSNPTPLTLDDIPNPADRGVYTAVGCVPTDPAIFINNLLRVAIGAGGGIALLLMVRGVFEIMGSAGNQEAVHKGRDQLISAGIGLLFIIFAVLLLKFIGINILQIPGFSS